MTFNPIKSVIKRKEWNFLDLCSVIGGVMSTLTIIFSSFLIPFADHSFVLKAISSLLILKKNKKAYLFKDKTYHQNTLRTLQFGEKDDDN